MTCRRLGVAVDLDGFQRRLYLSTRIGVMGSLGVGASHVRRSTRGSVPWDRNSTSPEWKGYIE